MEYISENKICKAIEECLSYDEYMKFKGEGMEMHVLSQQKIFEVIYTNHCIPLEVYQDNSTGKDDYSVWFVVRNSADE